MIVIAHRGWSGPGRPENTVAAVSAAFDAGAGGVEVDVRLTSDGVPVCSHDATLARLAGSPVPVAAAGWADLSRVRLPGGHRFARLVEVVEAVPDGATLVVEFKPAPGAVVAAVADLLVAASRRMRVVASSFSPELVRLVGAAAPTVDTALTGYHGVELADLAAAARRLGATGVHPQLTTALAGATTITGLGLSVVPWTVNRPVDAACLAAAGAEAIITDDPGAATGALLRPLAGAAI